MTIDASVTDFLNGGGAKSAKFTNIGDTLIGTITAAKTAQQTDLDGTPKTWDNGDPMMQLIITLDTDQRDPDDEHDDGSRNLYVKGAKKDPTTSAGALVVALRESGAAGLDLGGRLAVKYEGNGVPKKAGLTAPKQYRMQYQAPALVAGADLFGSDETTAPAPTQAPAAAAPTAASGDMFAQV